MKKIVIKNIKSDLELLNADKSTTELILNNVMLYNDLVEKYKNGDVKNMYLMYQLNNQIIKQMEGIKNINLKEKSISLKNSNGVEEDPFEQMKKRIEKRSE